MNASALLAFAHHLAAFTLVAAITVELVLLDRTLSLGQAGARVNKPIVINT